MQTLSEAGIPAEACSSAARLCERIAEGAGAALLAAEDLTSEAQDVLERELATQPEWSDFPLVIMETSRGGRTPSTALVRVSSLSYAAVLVRPVHTYSLVSTVRAALLSRSRQYQVRDELAERKRVEAALRESNERKDEFLAMLGHELRNPLSAIRNATQLMKVAPHNGDGLKKAYGVLDRQSLHMTRLIDGLLEVARIARGKISLAPETLDVGEILEATLQDRNAQAQKRQVELASDLSSEPIWVRADRSRLTQIFDNLIGNALKFTDPPGSIRVSLKREDEYAVIRVSDTGVGIRPEMLERLFEPFQQEEQDVARAAGGLGLGLALARGLVELQGGSIRGYSAGPGTGAEFEVRFPLFAAPSASEPMAQPAPPISCRVLIIEDNLDAGESLCALLEIKGYQATLVGTGAEAVEFLQSHGADVVLCDLGLPGMSGYELARTVRAEESLREIPLVAVTGYGQPEDRRRTAEAGFDEHVTKPVEVEPLTVLLNRLTAGHAVA